MRRKEEKFFLNKKNKEKKLRPGQLYWELLKVIGMTLVSGGGGIMRPMLPIAIEEVIRITKEISKANIREASIKKSLENLEKKEIIDLIEKDNNVFVYIKDHNHPFILKYSIKSLLDLKKNKKWNGKWFLVYAYRNKPQITKLTNSLSGGMHEGFTYLDVESDNKLEGYYANDENRKTRGKLVLTKIN